jgi:alkylhydroperoxidase/carboxymuconolactone decarboxylase family protein YurZ
MTMSEKPTWQIILEKHAPELLKQAIGLQEMAIGDGALSAKMKTLMMVLCDALLAHPEGVAGLANRARALGASEDEITETLAVAFLMGGLPGLVTGTNAFKD